MSRTKEGLIIGLYLHNIGILACSDIESAHILVDTLLIISYLIKPLISSIKLTNHQVLAEQCEAIIITRIARPERWGLFDFIIFNKTLQARL
jgi:hypothetical protein